MTKAYTRLDDETIAKIEATGKSVYQYLQEAVDLKLNNDKALDTDRFVAAQFIDFEAVLEKKMSDYRSDIERLFDAKVNLLEERMLAVVNISHKLLVEATEKAEKLLNASIEKDEYFKTRTGENLKRIIEIVKGAK